MTEKKKAPAAESAEKVSVSRPAAKPQVVNVNEKLGLPTTPYAVITPGVDADTVVASSVVYKNLHAKKSLTIHHLQRRLAELGYHDAYSDKDGWYGDLSQLSVDQWRKDNGLDGEGVPTFEELEIIFKDDPNVEVTP